MSLYVFNSIMFMILKIIVKFFIIHNLISLQSKIFKKSCPYGKKEEQSDNLIYLKFNLGPKYLHVYVSVPNILGSMLRTYIFLSGCGRETKRK